MSAFRYESLDITTKRSTRDGGRFDPVAQVSLLSDDPGSRWCVWPCGTILTGMRQSIVSIVEEYGTNNIYAFHLSTGFGPLIGRATASL
jgi:hypothetical protein